MSNTDRELEMVGMAILNVFKGIFQFFKSICNGIIELKEKKSRIYCLISLVVLSIGLLLFREKIWSLIPKGNERIEVFKHLIYLSPVIPILYLNFLGENQKNLTESYDEMFEKIGFYGKGKVKKKNDKGEFVDVKDYPRFMGKTTEGDITIYSFHSNINLQEWRGKKLDLEIALDRNILKIENAKTTKKVVKIHTVPSDMAISEYLEWKDEYISQEDFNLVIGENMLDIVSFNLNQLPHILVAGETGSGKSVILRLILWQAANKAATIYMFDFKGGVEFGKRYEQFGEVITKRQRALEVLKELTYENQTRLEYFRELDVKNLGEYNTWAESKGDKKLARIIVFIDEIAEMLDKKGVSNEDKKVMLQLEKEISTLARLSRATGINLVVGVQRPDAQVLTGQIKNNIPVRISGRFADKPASEIVLGNSRATELPKTKGRFMFKVGADTLEFQAYYFDDNRMLRDIKIKTGGLLTKEEHNEIQKDKEEKIIITDEKKKDLEKLDKGIEGQEFLEMDLQEDYDKAGDIEVDFNDHDLYGELEDEEYEIIDEEGF